MSTTNRPCTGVVVAPTWSGACEQRASDRVELSSLAERHRTQNDPTVDGAATRCRQHRLVDVAHSASTSSMQSLPANAEWIAVRHVSVASGPAVPRSSSSCATKQQPASATNDISAAVTDMFSRSCDARTNVVLLFHCRDLGLVTLIVKVNSTRFPLPHRSPALEPVDAGETTSTRLM